MFHFLLKSFVKIHNHLLDLAFRLKHSLDLVLGEQLEGVLVEDRGVACTALLSVGRMLKPL